MIYVVAGTKHEADYWIINDISKRYLKDNKGYLKDNKAKMTDYTYVTNAQCLAGVENPHGVFIGNWMGRPDIKDIVETLMRSNANTALAKIYKELQ